MTSRPSRLYSVLYKPQVLYNYVFVLFYLIILPSLPQSHRYEPLREEEKWRVYPTDVSSFTDYFGERSDVI